MCYKFNEDNKNGPHQKKKKQLLKHKIYKKLKKMC